MAAQQRRRELSVCAKKRDSMHRNALNMVWMEFEGCSNGALKKKTRKILQVVVVSVCLRSNGFSFFSIFILLFHASALKRK
jgi:hypothetical protein